MKLSFFVNAVTAGCLMAAAGLCAGVAAAQNAPANSPQPPASTQQKPAAPPAKPGDANAFPEDTTGVPVMPSKGTPALPEGTYSGDDNAGAAAHMAVPNEDADPVKSPDDAPSPNESPAMELSGSDSRSGLDKVMPDADPDSLPDSKHKKMSVPGPEHKETAKEDLQVGGYYLETKNWKAALSRFESAMVLDPDEPDVYWGLAESQRHLGNLAAARENYQKVAEYDPDSRHGKEAMKALKEPEIANAKAAAPVGK